MANRTVPIAQPPVTFSPAELQAVIAAAIAEHEAAKAQRAKASTSDKYTALTISAFKRAGFKPEDIKPRENTLTFNKWLEKGYRPKEGERAIAVKGLRLFHASQVRELTAQDGDMVAAKAAKGVPVATADLLAKPSPVEPAKPAVKAAKASKAAKPAAAAQPQA